MKQESVINNKFYQDVFSIWNNNPDYYWDGFWLLLPYLDRCFEGKEHIRVLDLGCGNGRFFNFLEFCFKDKKFLKVGIDFVDFELVNDFEFLKFDLVSDEFLVSNLGEFDLITAFGVYHHIQGFKTRLGLTKKINNLLEDNGLFIFTRWNFLLLPRLKKKILSLEKLLFYYPNFDSKNLEIGDYYLLWDKVRTSIRYANFLDLSEIASMLENSDLECKYSYMADDRENNRNSYFVNYKK